MLLSQCSPYDSTTSLSTGGTQYLAGYGPATGAANDRAVQSSRQPQGFWDGAGVSGPAKIFINRAEQKAYFYKGSTLVGMTPLSSGNEENITPPGKFKITQKSKDHKSSLYGVIKNKFTGEITNNNADTRIHKAGPDEVFENAPMPYFLRFNYGIGMHTGFLPGYAASHGCVRLPNEMAKVFFENAKIGTPVIVE